MIAIHGQNQTIAYSAYNVFQLNIFESCVVILVILNFNDLVAQLCILINEVVLSNLLLNE